MKKRKGAVLTMTMLLLALAAPALAQSDTEYTQIEEKSYQGIPYVTGGVGVGEREELEGRLSDYNLHLIFALEDEGKYLGRVDVTILDPSGATVLETTTDGPWLLARLPEGHYTVRATTRGETLEKTVDVKGGQMEEVAVLY